MWDLVEGHLCVTEVATFLLLLMNVKFGLVG
jgi:hypothetical protein